MITTNNISDGFAQDEQLSNKSHPFRRYFARFLDICVFIIFGSAPLIFLFGYNFSKYSPELTQQIVVFMQTNPVSFIVSTLITLLLVAPMEAMWLTAIGATPGKFVFGIKVLTENGEKLSFSKALKRSLFVWTIWLIPLVNVVMFAMSYFHLKNNGKTKWDEHLNISITHIKWSTFRVLFVVFCFLFVSAAFVVMESITQYASNLPSNYPSYYQREELNDGKFSTAEICENYGYGVFIGIHSYNKELTLPRVKNIIASKYNPTGE